jgi:GNAT superfamily N-acetyltransferase
VSIEIRAADSDAELALSLEIHNTVLPHRAVTSAEVDSYRSAALDYREYVAYASGGAAGSVAIALEPHQRPGGVATVILTVLADRRRLGAGSALYAAVSDWARERELTTLEAAVREDDTESLGFAERRGFRETGRNSRLVLELTGIEAPAVEPPAGVEIVTWADRLELVRGMYEVACDAYPDVPDASDRELESFEDWLAHDLQGSGDWPEATFVAVAGDEVVGYAKFSMTAAQPKVAFHDMTGVRRAWRGRGIARALKAAEIAWAIGAGYVRLETMNEERNEPIRRLNQEFGYRLAPGAITLRGPLAPVSGGS